MKGTPGRLYVKECIVMIKLLSRLVIEISRDHIHETQFSMTILGPRRTTSSCVGLPAHSHVPYARTPKNGLPTQSLNTQKVARRLSLKALLPSLRLSEWTNTLLIYQTSFAITATFTIHRSTDFAQGQQAILTKHNSDSNRDYNKPRSVASASNSSSGLDYKAIETMDATQPCRCHRRC